MDRSTEILLHAIVAERALDEMPAHQERRRLARLVAELARCCRVSLVHRLAAAFDWPADRATGAIR